MNRRLIRSAIITLLLTVSNQMIAQNLGFSYQAVAIDRSKSQGFGKDTRGEVLANKDVALRFSLLEGSENGPIQYQETHKTTTDIFGIFRLIIGRGLSNDSNKLHELDWGNTTYFLQTEIDLGNGYELLGIEELLGSPYALNNVTQSLSLTNSELSLSGANTVLLADNDATNELITSIEVIDGALTITDAGGTKSVDLGIPQGEETVTDELQSLFLVDQKLGITQDPTSSPVDLSSFLDDTNLTEAQVDSFVSNNGFITTEVDGSPTNELQDIFLSGSDLSITQGSSIDLSFLDTDTRLSEVEVDGYVSNNGYLLSEIDGSVTNEIQDISISGANLSITNGSTVNLVEVITANDDQSLSLSGTILNIDDGEGVDLSSIQDGNGTDDQTLTLSANMLSIEDGNAIDLSNYQNTDTQELATDGTPGDVSLADGGQITINVNDADANSTNELVTGFLINGTNLELTDAGGTRQVPLGELAEPGSDDQNLTLVGTTLNIEDGTGVDLVVLQDGTGTDDQQLTLTGSALSIEDGNAIDLSGFQNTDSQDLSTDGTSGDIRLTDGGNITINVDDADASVTNELVTGFAVNGSNLELTDAGGTRQVALGDLGDGIGTDDQDLILTGNTLSIEGGNNVDLSGLANTDTQDLSTDGTAGDIRLTDGGNITINVNDADASATNELVTGFAVNGSNLELTDAGGTQQVALGDLGDGIGTDDQDLILTGNTLSIEGGNNVDLSGLANTDTQDLSTNGTAGDISLTDGGSITLNVDDADADAENEIQDLALDETTDILTITNNESATDIDLSPYFSPFATTGNVTSNQNGSYEDDNFVFGSPQMDDDGDGDHESRMFFNKDKAAFRAGETDGSQWNDDQVGESSVALGSNSIASGEESVAIGTDLDSSGDNATAIGNDNVASGENSLAMGEETTASGIVSTTLGYETRAIGDYSTSIGLNTSARSFGELAVGTFNTTYTPSSAIAYNTTDRLLVIGNGVTEDAESDALVMLKNGNTTLNGELTIDGDNTGGDDGYTLPSQDGSNGQVLTTDGAGNTSWQEPIIPVGGIIMWSGTIADIPAGWALCDGSGSTPDLRGRFVVSYEGGSTDYGTVGQTGGQSSQTLTADQLPTHQHELDGAGATATISDDTHDHFVSIDANPISVEGGGGATAFDSFGGGGPLNGNTDSNTHDHVISGNTGNGLGLTGNAIDNRPAYFTLAFIMKL